MSYDQAADLQRGALTAVVCASTAWPPRRQQIKQVQREYHAAEGGSGRFEAQSGAGAQFEGADAGGVELPAAEIANLEEIAKVWGLPCVGAAAGGGCVESPDLKMTTHRRSSRCGSCTVCGLTCVGPALCSARGGGSTGRRCRGRGVTRAQTCW